MTNDAAQSSLSPPTLWQSFRQMLRLLGPGIVLILASVGPRDLITNSIAGANYGYRLLWIVVLASFARYLLMEAGARYVIATGETLLSGFRRVGGRWSGWLVVLAIFGKRHLSNLYHMLLLGVSFSLLSGIDTKFARNTAALASFVVAFCLMYFGGYKGVERRSKLLTGVLGASLLAIVLLAMPDLPTLFGDAFRIAIPEAGSGYGPFVVIMILLGGNLESVTNLKYSAFVFEKGWRDPSHLRQIRLDLVTGILGSLIMVMLIQIAAGATLHPRGLHVKELDDLVSMFTAVLGPAGKVLLCVSIWTIVFNTYIGSNMGYSLLTADLLVPVPDRAADEATQKEFEMSRRNIYRRALLVYCIPPLYVFWTSWKPLPLVLASATMFAAAIPLVVVLILVLANDKKRMGACANGPLANTLFGLVLILTSFATWEAVGEVLKDFRR
jgi:Mn2+/Fe2+ NRAMP family transporter